MNSWQKTENKLKKNSNRGVDQKDSAWLPKAKTPSPITAYVPSIHFPQRLQKQKLDKQFAKFLSYL